MQPASSSMVFNEFSCEEDAQFLIILTFYMVHNLSMNLSPFLFFRVKTILIQQTYEGEKVFLPLLQSSMVILTLFLKKNCDFALVILKRSSHLPLLCNTVWLAGIKWKKKIEKEKMPRGKDSNAPSLISFYPVGSQKRNATKLVMQGCREVGVGGECLRTGRTLQQSWNTYKAKVCVH